MYAVIFKAKVNTSILDQHYYDTAALMRDKAQSEYGCLDFLSIMEGEQEISISYWPDLDAIRAWKPDADHLEAQRMGRSRWYRDYQVEIVELQGSYHFPEIEK